MKIPSLAERPGDAVLLARHFVNRFGKELNTKVQSLSADAIAAIDAYGWPGNVRELENRIKRAVIMADGKIVSADDLDLPGSGARRGGGAGAQPARRPRSADRRAIRQALSRTDNNISGAAKLLGISRPTLYDLHQAIPAERPEARFLPRSSARDRRKSPALSDHPGPEIQ